MMDLFNPDKLLQFWPNSKQSYNDRIDAAARFVIYATFIAYMLRRDNRVIGVAAFILIVMFLFRRGNQKQKPTAKIPGADESFFPESRWTDRQFYTVPDNSDLDGFLKFAYGKNDTCRTNPEMCDPDNHPRMAETYHNRGARNLFYT